MSNPSGIIHFIEQRVPEPLTFALYLTMTMAGLTLIFTPIEPSSLLLEWGNSLSALLAFTMQMALIITVAYVLAHTGPMQGILVKLSLLAKSPSQAYVMVIITSALFSLLSWPLGPIVAGLLSREITKQAVRSRININYPLLAAGGFGGFVVWEMGYSSSIALAVATAGNPTHDVIGRLIPVQETLLTWWNLLSIATTLCIVIVTVLLLHRRIAANDTYVPSDMLSPLTEKTSEQALDLTNVGTRFLSVTTGLLVLAYVATWFSTNGVSLNLNVVNWTFLGIGLLLARSLSHYSQLFSDGARVAAPTLLQYPLYAGIMGMAIQSGLAEQFTHFLTEISSKAMLPIIGFFSAGVINIFIPSGGAQWALQGPSFIAAAQTLDVDLGLTTMAVAYGDQWTNLIQPFTAIPILALTGLRLRHIYGYALILCATTSLPLVAGLALANL